MKLVKRCMLSLSFVFAAMAAQAQSADEIISKHIEAIGGKEKLSAITSVKMANSIQVMGNDAPATVVILNGKGFRSESEFNGQKMIQVFTDKGGWMINPMMGSAEPTEIPEAQVKAGQAQIYVVPFLDFAAKGNKAEYLGQEKVGNINAYKIKVTDKNNTAANYFFDPATYYMIQMVRSAEMMGQQMEVTASFSDFKKTDYGWVVPQTSEMNMGGQFTFTSKLKSIEINAPVDPTVFDRKK